MSAFIGVSRHYEQVELRRDGVERLHERGDPIGNLPSLKRPREDEDDPIAQPEPLSRCLSDTGCPEKPTRVDTTGDHGHPLARDASERSQAVAERSAYRKYLSGASRSCPFESQETAGAPLPLPPRFPFRAGTGSSRSRTTPRLRRP